MILYHLMYHWQYEQNLLHKHSFPLVFVFDSFWSDEFSKFCYVYLPVFSLIAKPQYNGLINHENGYLLTYLAIYLTALDVPCVHASEITFESNAMFGFTFDLERDVKQYIFSTFRKEVPVAAPCKLAELAEPTQTKQVDVIGKPKESLIGNLLANDLFVLKNENPKHSKTSMRRMMTVYALIAMFQDKKNMDDQVEPFLHDKF